MTQLQEPQPYWAYGWMFGHAIKVKAAKEGKKWCTSQRLKLIDFLGGKSNELPITRDGLLFYFAGLMRLLTLVECDYCSHIIFEHQIMEEKFGIQIYLMTVT
jgi:hypothetical protein